MRYESPRFFGLGLRCKLGNPANCDGLIATRARALTPLAKDYRRSNRARAALVGRGWRSA
jgi:hypothetical protein